MGKVTGFMDYARVEEDHEPVPERVKNYHEFVFTLTEEEAKVQSARCMDCGMPFCNNGCPVNNIIPDFNDLVYRADWKNAFAVLDSTNNFPEFTGRICPAPCEAACTLNINDDPVGIKSIEHAIIDRAWAEGWVVPQPASGEDRQEGGRRRLGPGRPRRRAAARARRPRGDGVREERRDRRPAALRHPRLQDGEVAHRPSRRADGGRRRGLPHRRSRRRSGAEARSSPTGRARSVRPAELLAEFDAIVLAAGGAEHSRDLPVPGRDLDGIHFAMEFLPQQNKVNAGDKVERQIRADGKDVIVIGGGDTGSDCVGTSNRQGAKSVTQFELLPMPPDQENKPLVWPYWPTKLRTSSSHEEGCEREFAIATKEFIGESGKLSALKAVRVEWEGGKMVEVAGTEQIIPTQLVLLAMGFVSPLQSLLDAFGVERDQRGNAKASTDALGGYATSVPKVFAAGDVRRGQSLVVWAIREGRQAARAVDAMLMGSSELPR